ncbi:MAG: acetyl-CoA carboxylase, biotin carboxyl carrier protein [Blautia sp.]
MEFEKIKELIESVSQSNLTRFELEDENLKISMYTDREQRLAVAPTVSAAMSLVPPMGEGVEGVDIRQQEAKGQVVKSLWWELSTVRPARGEPYVRIGDLVEKGQVWES